MHDDYKPLDAAGWTPLEPCPVCGSEAALWQYSASETAPRRLLVCCTHGDAIGPQDGITNEGCLLYMPPDNFYRETIRDAVRYWNEFAKALTAMRPPGVPVPDAGQRLNVLASFAHNILMGAIKPKEQSAKAREALERTGLLSLDDVVALGVTEADECGTCRKALPDGCNTEFQGEQSCALTHGVAGSLKENGNG